MPAVADVKREWRMFKSDRPGHRFRAQRARMQNGSRKLLVAQVSLGIVLLLGGAALLVLPGPGLLLIVFGLALVAGVSDRLAVVLDRMEPRIRKAGAAAKAWWERQATLVRALLIAVAAGVLGVAAYVAYRLWLG